MDVDRVRAKGLSSLAQSLQARQASYSRYCIYKAKILGGTEELAVPHCKVCNTLFNNDNHTVRLKPRQRLTKRLKKLLERYAELQDGQSERSLSRCQLNLVNRYLNGHNFLVTTCKVCCSSTNTEGQSRAERVQQLSDLSQSSVSKTSQPESCVSDSSGNGKKVKTRRQRAAVSHGRTGKNRKPMADLADEDLQTGFGLKTSLKKEQGSRRSVTHSLLTQEKSGGVAKKKKGRNMHKHLEKLLKSQHASEQKLKSGNKSSLVNFLDQLTY